jgi:hypothetical protein
MASKYLWARVKPYAPKQGCVVIRRNIENVLYEGGPNPTWYKIGLALADKLALERQKDNDENSLPVFEIVDDKTKDKLAKVEQDRRMAQLGMISGNSSVPGSARTSTVDLTPPEEAKKGRRVVSGREAAIPSGRKTDAGTLTTEDISPSRRTVRSSGARR